MRTLAKGLLVGGATLALLFAVGVNVLLSSGALARILSARPEKLRVEYAQARTLWPGRVRVEGLIITGQDPRLEWQLRIDAADADIALLPLLWRRFRVESVVATGVTFRVRFRLEAKDATADRIARIPPIPGLDAVPLRDLEREATEEAEGKRASFSIQIANAEVRGLREVWIDSLRLRGDMSAGGGFQLGPEHRLDVTPSRLLVRDATLAVGEDAILSKLSGAADAVLEPVDLERTKGAQVLRALTSHSGFAGEAGGIRFLQHFLVRPGAAPITLEGGEGTFEGLLVMERGIVKPGSRSHAELGLARVSVEGNALEARTVFDLAVGEDDGGGWTRGDVAVSSFQLSVPGRPHPVIVSPSLALGIKVATTDMAEPPRDFTYACDAPAVVAEDLSWLDEALPKDGPFHLDGGKATARVRAQGSIAEATADLTLTSPRSVSLRFDGAAAETVVDARVHSHARFDARTIDLAGSEVALKGLALRGGGGHADWWGKARLESAVIQTSPPTFHATITTSARDARPLLSLYSAMRHTSAAVRTALALVPEPLVESMTADLHGGLRIVAAARALDLHGLDVRGAQTRLRAELAKRGEAKSGGLLFEAAGGAVGVSFEGDRTGVVLIDAPRWFEGIGGRGKAP